MTQAATATQRYRREWRRHVNFLVPPHRPAGWSPGRTPRDEPPRAYRVSACDGVPLVMPEPEPDLCLMGTIFWGGTS
jgi:hypothetical protein